MLPVVMPERVRSSDLIASSMHSLPTKYAGGPIDVSKRLSYPAFWNHYTICSKRCCGKAVSKGREVLNNSCQTLIKLFVGDFIRVGMCIQGARLLTQSRSDDTIVLLPPADRPSRAAGSLGDPGLWMQCEGSGEEVRIYLNPWSPRPSSLYPLGKGYHGNFQRIAGSMPRLIQVLDHRLCVAAAKRKLFSQEEVRALC